MNDLTARDAPAASLLARCRACLVAETATQDRTLSALARRTGFVDIHLGIPENHPAGPLPFFFFHCDLDPASIARTLGRIRSHAGLRFSPAVMVMGTALEADVLRYIGMGFDDIVVLPKAAASLRDRFCAQLSGPVAYYETDTYFGPDRRRNFRTSANHRTDTAVRRYTRYLIQRRTWGVDVLRREVLTNQPTSLGQI